MWNPVVALSRAEKRVCADLVRAHVGKRRRLMRATAVRAGDDRVLRVSDDAGASWIVKRRGQGTEEERLFLSWGFYAEWAGSVFAARRAPEVAPAFIGGDRDTRMLVFADLGQGPDLSRVVRGPDRERARELLEAMGAALGTLHARGHGNQTEYLAIWRELCGDRPAPALTATGGDSLGAWVTEALRPLGLARPRLARLLEPVDAWVASGGAPRTFLHGDPCLDNWIVDANGRARLIDYQGAAWGPAALDASYARAPFPTCWCLRRLPREVIAGFERTHRAAMKAGAPALSAAEHGRELTYACAWWSCQQIRWRMAAADAQLPARRREDFDLVPERAQILLRMDSFLEASATHRVLGSLAAEMSHLRSALARRWELRGTDVPLYPAFL